MNLHRISNGYSSAYLVVDGGDAMLVDASTPAITPKVLRALEALGARLRLIVLTHHHFDHTGAAEPLRRATGARIAVHHLDAAALRDGGALTLHPNRPLGRVLAPVFSQKTTRSVTADLELGDADDLSEHGGFGQTFWTPGHTPGSQSVRLPDGTVLVGDALSEGFPPLHRAERAMFAESADDVRTSIAAIDQHARGDVYAAHFGRLATGSVHRLAVRTGTR